MSIEELRKHRIFGIAIFDLVFGMVGTVLIFLIAKWKHFPNLPFTPFIIYGILLTIHFGIIMHIIFGVNTSLNYRLGLSGKPESKI